DVDRIAAEIPNVVATTQPASIAQQGYPYEEHFVTTRDGYVLTVHRISGPRGTKSGNANPRRKSLLLLHGFLMSSTGFLALGPEYSLGYILADAGYDVWLGNFRGNTYSRNHTSLNPDSNKSFWHFSRDEMSEYDVPAMIDHIITQTGHRQVIILGLSLGGTIGLMTATNRTVAEKKMMPVIFANLFEGSSARTISHAAQPECEIERLDIGFHKFDFGEAENRRRYGHVTPPAYNVSRIPCPVALYWAENDPTTKTKVHHDEPQHNIIYYEIE
ncbi:hypothetical protein HAZT_HAZT009251, partial [Hyalella azteca]